jgi:translation initiation factor 2 subunit 3
MVTMLSGASLMDGALFVIASDVTCPQAQDREHLLAAEIAGLDKLVIVQNKIDIVDQKRAVESYREIQKFLKKTIAEDAPIIPVSAQHATNIDVLIEALEKHIPTPKRDAKASAKMYVLRSFDVNKPGTEPEDLKGGVIGGSIAQGVVKVGDEIEIRPGTRSESGGKATYEPIQTAVVSLRAGGRSVTEARCGGLVAVGTDLDPALTRSDSLTGSAAGKPGTLPDVLENLTLDAHLFERVVGTDGMSQVEKIRTKEPLVLNVATSVTSGLVTSARDSVVEISLRKHICVDPSSKVAISRRIGEGWRLIGYGTMK